MSVTTRLHVVRIRRAVRTLGDTVSELSAMPLDTDEEQEITELFDSLAELVVLHWEQRRMKRRPAVAARGRRRRSPVVSGE